MSKVRKSVSLLLFGAVAIISLQVSLCEEKVTLISLMQAYKLLYKKSGQFDADNGNTSAGSKSDVYSQTTDFVTKYGYPVETHTVTTEDGYLLTVHRIPGSPRATSSGVKTPVFLQHGIFSASDNWVLMGPEKALVTCECRVGYIIQCVPAFVLADQGYDVWLGNARGNFYSRKHVTLSPKSPKFWDFSWHEMGVYDLPAVIDHILKTTNQKQLFYVGHSMGTTMFFVLTSMKPEYNAKIRLMVALSPVVFNKELRQKTLKALIPQTPMLYWSMKTTGLKINELFPRQKSYMQLIDMTCREGQVTQDICINIFSTAIGNHQESINKTMLPIILSHVLSGSSLNAILHFSEIFKAERFQMFDRSVKQGTLMPEYDLSKVTAKVALYYATNDVLVHPDGVMKLSKTLPNVVDIHCLPDEKATHVDFVFANGVKQLVNDDLLALLKKN